MGVWLTVAIVVAGTWLVAATVLVVVGRRFAARELMMLVPNLARLFRHLIRDRRVPLSSKLVLAFTVAWVVSPIDLVPEFIPIIGPLDDIIVGVLALRFVVRRAGEDLVREHWRGDARSLALLLRLADPRSRLIPT